MQSFVLELRYWMFLCLLDVFVAEEQTDEKYQSTTFAVIFKIFARHLTNSHMRTYLGYMYACRVVYYMIDPIFYILLIHNGYAHLSRRYISKIDTVYSLIFFLLTYLTIYYLEPGHLLKLAFVNTCTVVLHRVFKYIIVLDLIENRVKGLA